MKEAIYNLPHSSNRISVIYLKIDIFHFSVFFSFFHCIEFAEHLYPSPNIKQSEFVQLSCRASVLQAHINSGVGERIHTSASQFLNVL